MGTCYRWALRILLVAGLAHAAPVSAQNILAPVSGAAVPVGKGRIACKEGSELRGWTIEGDGQRIRPPAASGIEVLPASLRVAEVASQCANANEMMRAAAVSGWPGVDPSSLLLGVDAGRLDVKGHGLHGAVLRWQSRGKQGSDVCRDPQTTDGLDNCAFGVERDLSADVGGTDLAFYPPGTPGDGPLLLYDASGRLRDDVPHFNPARLMLLSILPTDAALDVEADVGRIPLKHPEAVGSVDCTDAACEVEGNEILVRGEHGSDEMLDMRVLLRPHVYLQTATGADNTPALQVPVQRCPVSIASSPPLRGIANQSLVVKVGGRCQRDGALRFTVPGSVAHLLQTQIEGDSLYAVLRVDRVGNDDVTVQIQRGGGVVGIAHGRTRAVPTVHARVDLDGLGSVDFIPTNRDASVILPTLSDGAVLAPLPVDGVYSVTHDASGNDRIRGIEGATGWVALRLAYRDRSLPPSLRDTNLAEISDAVDRSVKSASVPVVLGTQEDSLVELICNDADAKPERQKSGAANSVPYVSRDSCHLVLHRERLKPEDGEQALRITASITAVGGLPRPEAQVDQVIRLRPGNAPRLVYLGGVAAPFDRVVVRVGIVNDDVHYAVGIEEKIGAPPLQWSVIMGTSKLRLFASTSFPTGLFRIADKANSGILGLNGGILFRVIGLTDEGHQIPIGVETGVMWLGIAGESQIGVVAGLGISVPIANVSQMTQASISLHAWGEYEVSRAVAGELGNPWGFVFGPSLSVGDVGVNF